ncbi:MAG: DUF2341 domain-containing protein, partial [Patescibacteria group bacterium]|nr:DUF2341 domain-containing protein [Patescibacteria group bacterium]
MKLFKILLKNFLLIALIETTFLVSPHALAQYPLYTTQTGQSTQLQTVGTQITQTPENTPQPQFGGFWDTLVSFFSTVVTLNHPVHLESVKSGFKHSDTPKFMLSVPQQSTGAIGMQQTDSWNYAGQEIHAVIVSPTGKEFPVTIKKTDQGTFELSVNTTNITPGQYSLRVDAKESFLYTRNLTQDFTWGVLAINTNKSMYVPGEKAQLSFGVLDSTGHTRCNATIVATITNPQGQITTLQTADKTILKAPECAGDSYITVPDYASSYQTSTAGTYQMHVVATLPDFGSHAIDDYFEVKPHVSMDIERTTFPTRIYPVAAYHVKLTITPQQDYSGIVSDFVPKTFQITDISDNGIAEEQLTNIKQSSDSALLTADAKAYAQFAGNKSTLLHALIPVYQKDISGNTVIDYEIPTYSNIDKTPIPISWNVSWQKGQTYTLTYTINFPPVSPEFYLLGPFTVGPSSHPVFQEIRQWEIASDANKCWIGASGGNWSTAGNWSASGAPGSADTANLTTAAPCSGTGTNTNSTIDASYAGTIGAVNIASGYTSTVTQSRNLTVSGSGGFAMSTGTWSLGANTLTVGGNFSTSGGTFTAGTGTVVFNDNTQTTVISGAVTFYNLTVATSSKQITFPASTTTTVTNALSLQGNPDGNVKLRSSSTNTQWNLVSNGSNTLTYLDIQDSNACSSTTQPLSATVSVNSTNNSCWTFPGVSWYNNSWTYRQKITINHISVPASQTNFPLLVYFSSNGTLAANAQSSGNDILFTDATGTTKINHEIEKYNSSTGELEAWVKVPVVSSINDTVIYLYYGNGSASNQQNATAVWDSNYTSVYHLGETSGSTYTDSTGNNSGTTTVAPSPSTSGQIDGAQSFNGNTTYIASGETNYPTTQFTVEAWINLNDSNNRYLFNNGDTFFADTSDGGGGTRKLSIHTGGSLQLTSTSTIPTGTLTHVVITRDSG